MGINTNKYISIPIEEYNRLENISNKKEDMKIIFEIYKIRNNTIHNYYDTQIYYDTLNTKPEDVVKYSELKDVANMITACANHIRFEFSEENKILRNELYCIKNKWWYKLFNKL